MFFPAVFPSVALRKTHIPLPAVPPADALCGTLSTIRSGRRHSRISADFPAPIPAETLSRNSGIFDQARPVSPLRQHFLVVVCHTALITAEPPPPSWSALFLIHDISARRANIYWYCIVPFGVVIMISARVAAEFLPRDVAGRDELFSAV